MVSPSTSAIDQRTKRRLYARYGVPHFWLVDPDARAIDDDYVLAARVTGSEPVDLPPFVDLRFVPSALSP